MLIELQVRELGVIGDLRLVLQPGMTALTGETGTGKTLVVEAIDLLLGGRADSVLVRPGADEATIEGRFLADGDEVVLSRVVPRSGRSRAYVNGRLATAAELARLGQGLVDLHGQHAHQSLLATAAQRRALDCFAPIDLQPLAEARARLAEVERALAASGGDSRARAREMDLLRFQVDELAAAALDDPDEEARLEAEEDALAGAEVHRRSGEEAHEALLGEGGAVDVLGRTVSLCEGKGPLAASEVRLRALAAELADVGGELRLTAEAIVEDPDRLQAVRERRRLLRALSRKYGERLSDMMAYEAEARAHLAELHAHDETVAALETQRAEAGAQVATEAATVARARREAAPRLAAAVEPHLRSLAMPRARFDVRVSGDDPADDVCFLLGANPGDEPLPLARVASGGELSRTMLAARLVLSQAPPTLIFDEVDAGVGGEAALAVGRALASLASDHQVLVVTHLPQVAAFADHQVAVTKQEGDGRTVASAQPLSESDRVVELSRMLSGRPESATARGHAEELLATASRERSR